MGSINTSEEKELAIKEMFIVARHSTKIVIVDEVLDPKLCNTKRDRSC